MEKIQKMKKSKFCRQFKEKWIYIFISILFLGLTPHLAYSQEKQSPVKITVNLKNQKLSDILKTIETESGYKINFSYEDVNKHKASLMVNGEPISVALDFLIKNTFNDSFEYVINNSSKIITFRKTGRTTGKIYNLPGKITDSQGEPLIGASIQIKNEKVGTTTDIEGNFNIPIPTNLKNPVLLTSYVGMKPQETVFKGQNYLEIVLEDATSLSEVVVTGIFNKAKESYTGAATSISSDDLKMSGNRSVITSIRNIDPSFNIADNLMIGSDPNSLPTITIRGGSSMNVDLNDLQSNSKILRKANQPLFIVDGFETTLEKVMDFDENRIENVTILKDANSTAMYGTRGANGVVVITTKKPEKGKIQLFYTGGVNIEAPNLNTYSLLNSREKLEYETAAGLYEASNPAKKQLLSDLYNSRKREVERGVDTYWIKYPVRTGVGSKHSIWLDGGESSIRYSANLSYRNTEGAMKGSFRNVMNGGMFLSYRVKNLLFMNDLQITSTKNQNSPYGNFKNYTEVNSYWKPYDDEGNLIKRLEYKFQYPSDIFAGVKSTNTLYNPLWNAYLPSRDDSRKMNIVNNFAIEWHLIPKELFLKGRFSIETADSRQDRYKSAEHTDFDEFVGEDFNRKGSYIYEPQYYSKYEADITANYSKIYKEKHVFYAGIGLNIAEEKEESYRIEAEGISIPNMDFLGMANKYIKDKGPSGYEDIRRRAGILGNVTYTYDRRYFADFSYKIEGSSQFGSDKRYAPFWSTGIGWNLYNEQFLKNNPKINIARLRLSYGTTGSQDFRPFQALTTYKDTSGKNYKDWYGVTIMAMGNPNLSWQVTNQFNVGAEGEFFNHRLKFNIDIYNKQTNSLLSDVSLPTSSGFSSYKANIGKVENKGIEVSASYFIIRDTRKDLIWTVGAFLVHNKNTIKKISNALEFLNDELSKNDGVNPSFLYKEGESLRTIYAVRSKGINPSNGLEIFVKKDGTETYDWDEKDKVACGTEDPKINGTFNTMLRFKGFTFTASLGYSWGAKAYNQTLAERVENINPYQNADKRVLYDRWKEPGDKTFFKSVKDFSKTYATSRLVMKNDYLKCQSIMLRYDIPTKWSREHLKISSLSLSSTIEDLFYISTIKRERGLNYPESKKIAFSVTARF